ncbi:MAG TPA: hypothetical protein VKU82_07490 [Planctomycetaceae bacterium]|nr:hypothetical protein [Planctomycetaceae bacterium]
MVSDLPFERVCSRDTSGCSIAARLLKSDWKPMNQNDSTNCICATRLAVWIAFGLCIAGCSRNAPSGAEPRAAASSRDPIEGAAVVSQVCEPYQIEITGMNERWQVRYAGADGRSPAAGKPRTIKNVHVPLGAKVIFVLKSADYVYALALPQFGLKEIAVPNREFRIEFCPESAGQFALLGDQLCGAPHPEMQGQLVVEPRERFLAWLNH